MRTLQRVISGLYHSNSYRGEDRDTHNGRSQSFLARWSILLSLGYPDPSKNCKRVWAIGFGGNVHSGMLLTHNCLPANASLVDFSTTYQAVP